MKEEGVDVFIQDYDIIMNNGESGLIGKVCTETNMPNLPRIYPKLDKHGLSQKTLPNVDFEPDFLPRFPAKFRRGQKSICLESRRI